MVRRTGRRPGNPDTRGLILQSARESFAASGYDRASIRQIAAAAGVDAALVHHYFGSKEKLFQEALAIPISPDELIPEIFSAAADDIPQRLLRTFLGVWEHPVTGAAMVTFLRTSVAHGVASALVKEFYATKILRAVRNELGDRMSADDPAFRVSLVASQLFGMALTRYVLRLEPLASMPSEAVVAAVAPTLQRYLFGEVRRV